MKIPMNWRTTIIGALGAVVTYVLNYLQTNQVVDWKALGTSAAFVLLGYFAKDAGVSGTAK